MIMIRAMIPNSIGNVMSLFYESKLKKTPYAGGFITNNLSD